MQPTIGKGTELSIGTVTGINRGGVMVEFKGAKFEVGFKLVEQVFEEDERKRNVDNPPTTP
jgi:hypothetical protein